MITRPYTRPNGLRTKPFIRPNGLKTRPFTRPHGLKTIPSPVAHTHIANIWEYPPPRVAGAMFSAKTYHTVYTINLAIGTHKTKQTPVGR